jgi:hypothetical protein
MLLRRGPSTPSRIFQACGKQNRPDPARLLAVPICRLANSSSISAGASKAACRTRVTERFRRVNFGKFEIEVTVDDPKAYTRPWTVKLNHLIALDTDLLDYFCLENEKDVVRLVGK